MNRSYENDLNNNYVESILLLETLFIKHICKCIFEKQKSSAIVETNIRKHILLIIILRILICLMRKHNCGKCLFIEIS